MLEPSEAVDLFQIDTAKLETMRQENIGRLFLRAHRAFSTRAVVKLQERGHLRLTLTHTALLMHLDTQGTHISTLADRAGMTRQSMGQLVRELAERGYVKRKEDTADSRAVIVEFTALGWQFLEDAYLVKQEIEAEYSARIGADQLQILQRLLQAVVADSS